MSSIRILLIHPPTLYTVSTSYFFLSVCTSLWACVCVCIERSHRSVPSIAPSVLYCLPYFLRQVFFFWPRAPILGKGCLATESTYAAVFMLMDLSFSQKTYPLGFCPPAPLCCLSTLFPLQSVLSSPSLIATAPTMLCWVLLCEIMCNIGDHEAATVTAWHKVCLHTVNAEWMNEWTSERVNEPFQRTRQYVTLTYSCYSLSLKKALGFSYALTIDDNDHVRCLVIESKVTWAALCYRPKSLEFTFLAFEFHQISRTLVKEQVLKAEETWWSCRKLPSVRTTAVKTSLHPSCDRPRKSHRTHA